MARKLLKSYDEILERQLLSRNTDKRRLFYYADFLTQGTIGPIWLRPSALAEVFTLLSYAKRKSLNRQSFLVEIYSLLSLVFSVNVFQDLIFTSLFFQLKVVYIFNNKLHFNCLIFPTGNYIALKPKQIRFVSEKTKQ